MAVRWPGETVKLWWCSVCNSPLLDSLCCKCGGHGFRIDLADPGDARPAFSYDVEILRNALELESGFNMFDKFIGYNSFILLNKLMYIDDMKEVFVNGVRLGKIFYNPVERRWRFRFSYTGALRALEIGFSKVLNVDWMVKRGVFLDASKFSNGDQVIIVFNGEPIAIAYVGKNGKARVLNVFKFRSRENNIPSRNTFLDDVYKCNSSYIYRLESRACKHIYVLWEKFKKPIVVSYSGGKDSLVSLHLTVSTVGGVQVLFNDTGIELPETVSNVYRVTDSMGLNLVVASAGDAFWRSFSVFGPPGRDYRWCCKICKLIPAARTALKHWPNEALNILGQRSFESIERSKNPPVWRNEWVPNLICTSPIYRWSSLAVWLYIHFKRLDVNKLYFKGFDRIGCFLCPASRLSEFKHVEETYPELWSKWRSLLSNWARKLGYSEEWVDFGLWRWLSNTSPKIKIARKVKIRIQDWNSSLLKWLNPVILEFKLGVDEAYVKLGSRIDPSLVLKQHRILGVLNQYDCETITLKGLNYTFKFNGSTLNIKGNCSIINIADVLGIIYRSLHCVKCGSCTYSCPTNSITVNSYVSVNEKSCISCRNCLRNCPIASQLVRKIVSILLASSQLNNKQTILNNTMNNQ
ncbi:MAG: phosphoadenosine phosphosulfate reductase family protein [Candidatus Methanomethylicia archaeon]